MGCILNNSLAPIPPPQGPAKNPLQAEGDVVQNIMIDPHINYFQNKIEQVLVPLRLRNKARKENKVIKSGVESYATTDKKQHEQYVKCLNNSIQGNDTSTTNILTFMFEEIADARQSNKARKFQGQAYAALKCFIFLYTGNYTYKKINSQLRRNEYEKISAVISVVKKQLQQYNKQKFSRKLKANKKLGKILSLYRAIPKPDKLMVKGNKMYWKAFTSTSLQAKVANRFGKFSYIIQLDNNAPHQYMIVPEQMSQFKQEQIIIFPYFYFQCSSVQDFQSGARYECRQIKCQQ